MKSIHDYKLGPCIGTGGFANVHRATSYLTGQDVAIKMINKRRILRKKLGERVKKEVEIHSRLKHPAILELYDVFEDDNYVYLILELAHNGEILQYVKDRGPVSENDARNYMKQIVGGVQYLHSHHIIHRDLTLANTFITKDLNVKIGDFGLATFAKPGVAHNTMCGTPNYISPEVVRRSDHGLAVDIWSLGCILYTLLVGHPPFEMDTVHGTLDRVIAGDYVIPECMNRHAADLIRSLLNSNPSKRPNLKEILGHPFITGDPLSKRERSDDSGRGSTHGGTLEISTFPAPIKTTECPHKRYPHECRRSYDDGIGSNNASPPVSSQYLRHSHNPKLLSQNDQENDKSNSLNPCDSNILRRHSVESSKRDDFKSSNSETSSKQSELQHYSVGPNISTGPLRTTRLRPIRIRLRRLFANILDDGSVCFEFLCPRKTTVATVIEVFEISPDGQRISVVRIPKPGWPTSEDLPALRASGAPGRVAIFSYESLPTKYHKKYNMATKFVQVCRSQTPKVTILSKLVKCTLMENGHDCVVIWREGDTSCGGVSSEVHMSQNFCRVRTSTDCIVVERPGQLNPEAQRLYRDAAILRERCRELESVMTRFDSENSFPVVVGSRHEPTIQSTFSKMVYSSGKINHESQKCYGLVNAEGNEVSTLSSVVKNQFVPHVGWSQQMSNGHIRVLLNDGSEIFMLPYAPIFQFKSREYDKTETYDLRRQTLSDEMKSIFQSLPDLPPSIKTVLNQVTSDTSITNYVKENNVHDS